MLFALKNGVDFQGENRLRFYAIGGGLKEGCYGTRGGGRKSFAPLLQGYGQEGACRVICQRARAQAGGLRSQEGRHRQSYVQEGTGRKPEAYDPIGAQAGAGEGWQAVAWAGRGSIGDFAVFGHEFKVFLISYGDTRHGSYYHAVGEVFVEI